jgi:predicted metalloendopeptidase
LISAFDNDGVNNDAGGNDRNWWDELSRQSFINRTECLVSQYNNFIEPMTKLHLNGVKTEGENIADNSKSIAGFR